MYFFYLRHRRFLLELSPVAEVIVFYSLVRGFISAEYISVWRSALRGEEVSDLIKTLTPARIVYIL